MKVQKDMASEYLYGHKMGSGISRVNPKQKLKKVKTNESVYTKI